MAVVMKWARECAAAWGTAAVLGMIFVFVVLPYVAPFLWPISRYYDLRSVTIRDAVEGTSPAMIVDRTIKRDFRGRYEVQILKVEGSELVAFWGCGDHVSRWRTYRADASLPADLNLDWWLDIPPNRECELRPGQYRIVTTVFVQTPFKGEVSLERQSNLFTIKAKR